MITNIIGLTLLLVGCLGSAYLASRPSFRHQTVIMYASFALTAFASNLMSTRWWLTAAACLLVVAVVVRFRRHRANRANA